MKQRLRASGQHGLAQVFAGTAKTPMAQTQTVRGAHEMQLEQPDAEVASGCAEDTSGEEVSDGELTPVLSPGGTHFLRGAERAGWLRQADVHRALPTLLAETHRMHSDLREREM